MAKIRVLHILQNLHTGGLERVAAQIAAGIDKDKFEAELWCLSGGGPLEAIFKDKIGAIRIFSYKRYLMPGNVLSIARHIRDGNFDITHTHGYAAGIVGRIASKMAGVKFIVHHHHSVSTGPMNFRNNFSERFVTKYFTDSVIACSVATKDFILKNRFADEHKITVVYNGVPLEFETLSGAADNMKRELGLGSDRVIAAVGSLTKHKGHIYLLQAFKEVIKILPSVKLVIAGEGPEREKLEDFIKDNGLTGKAVLAGNMSDVRPLLESADIFVLPSLMESMSISCAEAMSKKLPVIASRTGGVTEVVQDSVTGILAEPANPKELCEKIIYLLNTNEKRISMGIKGYDRYKEMFTFSGMINKIQDIYFSLGHC